MTLMPGMTGYLGAIARGEHAGAEAHAGHGEEVVCDKVKCEQDSWVLVPVNYITRVYSLSLLLIAVKNCYGHPS